MKTYIRRQQHKNLKHQDIKQKELPLKFRRGTISNTNLLAGLNRLYRTKLYRTKLYRTKMDLPIIKLTSTAMVLLKQDIFLIYYPPKLCKTANFEE